ncbi:MAG TPA: hypothetical protein VLQ93_25670, partial [Myxococcaceae bacterium]|nr:hypothetical protein [Myxococcaceae bacterium]
PPSLATASTGTPPATNLLTEDRRDGLANCLDRTGDYLSLLSPQQQARSEAVFLRDTRPGLEGQSGHVLVRQGDQYYDPTTRTSYASLAEFDPQGHYQVSGTVNGRELAHILDTPPGSTERQAAIARAGVPASLASMMVADTPETRTAELTRLTEAAATADSQLTELNAQLSRELARFGPAMTPEQRDQFIAGFQARHPEYQAALDAQQALGDYVQANFDQLRADALSNPATADALAGTMASLAGSPHNELVIQALNDGELTASLVEAAARKGIDFAERIHAPAIGTFATEGFLQAGTDTAAQRNVVDQLNTMLATHSQIPGLADNINVARQAVDALSSAIDNFAATRNFQQFTADLQAMNDGIRSPTPLGRAVAAAGFALGAMMIAEGVAGQDGDRLMQGLIQSAQNANALGYGAELLSKVAPRLISEAAARGAVELTRKFAGVVGVVTNGLDLWNQLHDLASNSDVMNAFGKMASTVGSVCMLVPGGQLPGVILTIVGSGLGILAGVMEGHEQQARNREFDQEALQILQGLQPPLDASVVSALQGMSPETIASTQQTLNLTPAEWTRFAQERPELVSALQQHGPHLMEQLGGAF